MNGRVAIAFATFVALSLTNAAADVGERASSEITRLQATRTFANVASDHGPLPAAHLERWKFDVTNGESRIFTVDAKNWSAPVARETFIRLTAIDPYSLRPGQSSGSEDLRDVLSPREYRDFTAAASVTTVTETPLHLAAHFYRGHHAAYEVLEPLARTPGLRDRFEWRSFPLAALKPAIAAARACDNGDDCATWY